MALRKGWGERERERERERGGGGGERDQYHKQAELVLRATSGCITLSAHCVTKMSP
jgi:hypothetical protein